MSKLTEVKSRYESGALSKPEYIERMHESHQGLYEYAEFIKPTAVGRIEISDGQVVMVMRDSGIKMICDPADHRLAPIDALNFGTYEQVETEAMVSLIDEGQTVFDIGANVGWYTLVLAKRFKEVKVKSFEPIPSTFRALKLHLELNGVDEKRVDVFPFGFWEEERNLTFYYYPQGSVNASAADLTAGEHVQRITCHVKRLDDFVSQGGYLVDFIKCDVEGAELLVFNGARRTIVEQKPVIFTEMLRKWSAKFNYHPNEIIALLSGFGYRCFAVSEAGLRECSAVDENTVETNYFFLHHEKHKGKIDHQFLGS